MVMDCKLCLKRFSNGKALGAHMRSHYAILPLPPKTHQQPITEDKQPPPPEKKKKKKKRSDPDLESESGSTRARGFAEDDVALCLIMLSRDVWRNSNSNSDLDLDSDSDKKIFRCDKCYKVFKSSQGLGSHKATHFKKMKMMKNNPIPSCSFQENDHQLLHECALCPRIFKSAQALGAHKRSHFPPDLVDLNLPPPALLHS